MEKIEAIVDQYDFELVVYDEIQNFKAYNDPLFNYPWDKRRVKV